MIIQQNFNHLGSDPNSTRGRLYLEKDTPYRNEFQRDKDRIIHSNAFKRLEYKTQVFINHEGDHYRNRLTHSIEVASIARSISSAFSLSEDLAECISLAHDLGHAPFGHAGERALSKCMEKYGGFCHNVHAIKILTTLEHRYAAYKGLNLTWEVLEGVAKHNGPLIGNINQYILEYNQINNLLLDQFASLEAQLAALSDDIAYNMHDIEDGVRAGILTIETISEIDFIDKCVFELKLKYDNLDNLRLVYEVIRMITHHLVKDLLKESAERIRSSNVKNNLDVRMYNKRLISFSDEVEKMIQNIKAVLFKKMYKHPKINRTLFKSNAIISGLFSLYMENPNYMYNDTLEYPEYDNEQMRAVAVCDYIAGMTDRYAIKEYKEFYDLDLLNH